MIASILAMVAVVFAPSVASAATDDYPSPWRAPTAKDAKIDSWGYYNRECTSFVAWRLHVRNGFEMPRAIGDAGAWGGWAASHGYPVDMNPSVGAVAWWNSGHVAWVEAINGATITIEEYNRDFTGYYNERTVAASSVSGYIHFKDLTVTVTNPDDIYAINRQDSGSNSTARHIVNGANWGQYLSNSGSALIPTNILWDFAVGDLNQDGHPDLWAFNRNPGGSNTAVHVLDGTNPNHYLQAGNIVLPGVSQDWSFALGDYNHDGVADIYAINRAPGTAHTEVRVINGANWGLYLQTGNIVLPAADANWDFAVADYNHDNMPDIYAINRQDAGSNSTAVHIINGANWGLYLLNTGTALIPTNALWDFAVGDLNGDGQPDLWAFNRNPGGSNTVVHVLNGANLNQYLQAGNIVLPASSSDWTFRVAAYN